MKINFHKSFKKQYKKLSPKIQKLFQKRFEIFQEDPFDCLLKNHALAGKYKSCRSINVSGDVRAVYTIDEGEIKFLSIGTHGELYT